MSLLFLICFGSVFEFEPVVNNKLMSMSNTVLMPHAGSATFTTRNEMVKLACKNINDYFLNIIMVCTIYLIRLNSVKISKFFKF